MRTGVVALALAVCLVGLQAQEPADLPTFDVASIKKWDGTPLTSIPPMPTGWFRRPAISLDALIRYAFDLYEHQLVNSPSWARTERFEVIARAADDSTPPAEMRLMMRALLADRFHLVTHYEQREMTTYGLTLTDPNAPLATRLKRNTDDCESLVVAGPGIPSGAVTTTGCGPVSTLASLASRTLETQVDDETELSGNFEYVLYFAPELTSFGQFETSVPNPELPRFETALQEQLGLRLSARKGVVDVLVVDSVERPSEN